MSADCEPHKQVEVVAVKKKRAAASAVVAIMWTGGMSVCDCWPSPWQPCELRRRAADSDRESKQRMSTTVADGLQASSDKSHLSFTFLFSPLHVQKVTSSARILRVMYGSDPLCLSLSAEITRVEEEKLCISAFYKGNYLFTTCSILLCFFRIFLSSRI